MFVINLLSPKHFVNNKNHLVPLNLFLMLGNYSVKYCFHVTYTISYPFRNHSITFPLWESYHRNAFLYTKVKKYIVFQTNFVHIFSH